MHPGLGARRCHGDDCQGAAECLWRVEDTLRGSRDSVSGDEEGQRGPGECCHPPLLPSDLSSNPHPDPDNSQPACGGWQPEGRAWARTRTCRRDNTCMHGPHSRQTYSMWAHSCSQPLQVHSLRSKEDWRLPQSGRPDSYMLSSDLCTAHIHGHTINIEVRCRD